HSLLSILSTFSLSLPAPAPTQLYTLSLHDALPICFSKATQAFLQRHRVFPILVAMERLDADACRKIAEQLPGTPVFDPDDYDMFQLVSILRACSYMVSSRYHAIVTSMPSLVACARVTMD